MCESYLEVIPMPLSFKKLLKTKRLISEIETIAKSYFIRLFQKFLQ